MDPLVTIVIPTFNRPDQLPGAVKSVLGQTYGNIEVIIHDNGSDVDARDILSSVSDPRLKVFRNPTTHGAFELPKEAQGRRCHPKINAMTFPAGENLHGIL